MTIFFLKLAIFSKPQCGLFRPLQHSDCCIDCPHSIRTYTRFLNRSIELIPQKRLSVVARIEHRVRTQWDIVLEKNWSARSRTSGFGSRRQISHEKDRQNNRKEHNFPFLQIGLVTHKLLKIKEGEGGGKWAEEEDIDKEREEGRERALISYYVLSLIEHDLSLNGQLAQGTLRCWPLP